MLTEKTRVLVTLSNFFMLIFAIISGVVFVVNWKADVEHRLSNVEDDVVIIKEEEKLIKNLQIDTQLKLTEIQVDVKWLRDSIENRE